MVKGQVQDVQGRLMGFADGLNMSYEKNRSQEWQPQEPE